MVLSVKFGLRPVMPLELNKLYQGIIMADGTWKIPTGPNVEMYTTWSSSFEAPNIYKITHDLNTSDMSIQIDMLEQTNSHTVTAIDDKGFTIATFNGAGEPAPCHWKFMLRKQH